MVILAAAALALQTVKSSTIINAMLAKYHQAQTLVGTIHRVQTATIGSSQVSQVIDTELQAEKPSKLYLLQRELPHGKHAAYTWLVTSDGKRFSYPVPRDLVKLKSDRLVESVNEPARGQVLNVANIYSVSCLSLGDRSEALGMIISWGEEIRRITRTWATIDPPERGVCRGISGFRIHGKHQELNDSQPIGTFEMFISDSSELLEYKITAAASADQSLSQVALVTSLWEIDVKCDVPTDGAKFKVVIH